MFVSCLECAGIAAPANAVYCLLHRPSLYLLKFTRLLICGFSGVYTPNEVCAISQNQTEEFLLAAAIAALHSTAFPDNLIGWLKMAVPCDSVVMIAYFQHRQPRILKRHSHRTSLHAELDRKYVEAAYLLDPFHELHVTGARKGVYRLSDIAPDQFQRNQYFATYYQETTLLDEMVLVAYPSQGVSIHVCLGRNANSNMRFSPRDIRQSRRIAPIVAALAETHWSGLDTSGEYQEADVIARLMQAVTEQHGVQLTKRQAEVAMYTLRGHSAFSTGLALGISHQTVKVFRKQLYRRFNISSQAELFHMLIPLLSYESTQLET